MNFTIRPYQPADEPQVRRICFETALYGRPIQAVFDDEAFVSDAWVSYYWRFEPELFWVAADEHRVLGYLTGCADTALFRRRYLWRIAPALVWQFIFRRHWLKPVFWAILRQWRVLLANGHRDTQGLLRDYPAHCHVNIAAVARGQGVGYALLMNFLEALKTRKIGGAHAVTATPGGTRLFMKAGFSPKLSFPAVRLTEESASIVQILVKELRM